MYIVEKTVTATTSLFHVLLKLYSFYVGYVTMGNLLTIIETSIAYEKF